MKCPSDSPTEADFRPISHLYNKVVQSGTGEDFSIFSKTARKTRKRRESVTSTKFHYAFQREIMVTLIKRKTDGDVQLSFPVINRKEFASVIASLRDTGDSMECPPPLDHGENLKIDY